MKNRRTKKVPSLNQPTILSKDIINEISDDELYNSLKKLRIELAQVRDEHCSSRTWEIELCYFEREAQLRQARREAHKIYLENLAQTNSTNSTNSESK